MSVQVRADLPSAQRTKTFAHDLLAHIALDHEHRAELSRERAEVEAESVAYLLCSELGLDSAAYTLGYVAHWSNGDQALVLATADRARSTSALLLDELAPIEEREVSDVEEEGLAQTA